MHMIDLLIITAPFTYTFGPSLAPALLKACSIQNQITTKTWDISAEFNHNFQQHEYYNSLISWMWSPDLTITPAEYDWYQATIAEYAEKIVAQYNPKNLAVSLLTQNSQRFAEDICYNVKKLNPEIKIILGGNGTDILQFLYQCKWYDLMLDGGLADAVILGEGEYALPRVIKQNLTGVIKEPQLSNEMLDVIPVPDYGDYDFSLYKSYTQSYWHAGEDVKAQEDLIFMITASKGCVKDCTFCDVGKIWSRFRYRSAESVANEIIALNKKYNACYFSFTDSLINGGIKIFHELNTILAEKIPNTIRYEGQMIARSRKDMPERYYQAMAQAGCYSVSIGMESGSEQVRMHMRKGSQQDDVYYTTEMLTKYNIRQRWTIMAGYPTETDDDWQETMNLIKHWLPRTNGLLSIAPTGTFLLLENTPITEPDAYHALKLEQNVVQGYSQYAWSTALNKGNTFETRFNRFLELCLYLQSYDPIKYAYLDSKIALTQKQLTRYLDEFKHKKFFSLSEIKNTSVATQVT